MLLVGAATTTTTASRRAVRPLSSFAWRCFLEFVWSASFRDRRARPLDDSAGSPAKGGPWHRRGTSSAFRACRPCVRRGHGQAAAGFLRQGAGPNTAAGAPGFCCRPRAGPEAAGPGVQATSASAAATTAGAAATAAGAAAPARSPPFVDRPAAGSAAAERHGAAATHAAVDVHSLPRQYVLYAGGQRLPPENELPEALPSAARCSPPCFPLSNNS